MFTLSHRAIVTGIVIVGLATAASAGNLEGRLTIFVDDAVFQKRILDGKEFEGEPTQLVLETTHGSGGFSNVLGLAPNFNRGHHRGRVLDSTITDKAVALDIEMRIAGDPWVPGGRARYKIDLRFTGKDKLVGTWTGTFHGKQLSGRATAEVAPLPQAPADFVPVTPGEHPRILFRKADIPAIVAKAENSHVCKAAMDKIKSDTGNPVSLGVMYQFTGDRKHAQAAIEPLRKVMAERSPGSFNTGHAWGERLAEVALVYDLCKDGWDDEFVKEVQAYLNWITERLIMRPNSVSQKVNWSPNSNYHAFLRGGAGIGAMALWGDKNGRPSPPRKPHDEPLRVEANNPDVDKSLVWKFQADVMPQNWLWTGYAEDKLDELDILEQLGGGAGDKMRHGQKVTLGDAAVEISPLDAKHYWDEKRYMRNIGVDLTSAYNRQFDSTAYFFCVLDNDKEALYRLNTGTSTSSNVVAWISGQQIWNGDFVYLGAGRHSVLLRVRIGETEPWGKLWMEPRFVAADIDQAKSELITRTDDYELSLAEFEEDQRDWTASDGGNPHWLYLDKLAEYHMGQYYRYCFGDGGYQVEGEGYTLYSCPIALEYAAAYLKMRGKSVTGRPDVSHFPCRYVAQSVFYTETAKEGPRNRVEAQSFSVSSGTMSSRHYSRVFPLVPDEYKPAVLWAWNHSMGLDENGEGKPQFGGGADAVYTLLHYPLDIKPQNPAKCMPRTWAATTKGCYIFRNAWAGKDDIVAQIFARSEGEGGWNHPDAGCLRINGLGYAWAMEGEGAPKSGNRWHNNVVMFPVDRINERGRAFVTAYNTLPDGSGVISMDMNAVYSGKKMITDSTGKTREVGLVDNNFIMNPDALEDLGIRGLRSFAVDYSGASGAPAMFVLVDKIAGGHDKVWQWQLPSGRDEAADLVTITDNAFTVRRGDVTLCATFVTPSSVKIEHVREKRSINAVGEERAVELPLHAIHATGGDSFFVVMTLQRGDAPAVKVQGKGLDAKVTVGKQTLGFDGEKIVVGK